MSRSGTSETRRFHFQGDRVRRPAIALLGCAMAASFAVTAPANADTTAFSPPGAANHGLLPAITPGGAPPTQVPVALRSQARPASQVVVAHTLANNSVPQGVSRVASWRSGSVVKKVPARPVADSVAAPGSIIKVGNIDFRRPGSISPQAAEAITAGSEDVVRAISDVLRGNGVSDARADKVAEQMVGDAVVGGVIGGAAVLPIGLAIGAPTGGLVGFLFGIPFLPTGLVVGPLVGTALVATLVALPAVTAGIAIGAAHGYQKGWTVPLDKPQPKHHEAAHRQHQRNASAPAEPGIVPKPLSPVPAVRQIAPPAARVPAVTLPEVKPPKIEIPEVKLPEIKFPEVKVPVVELPRIELPELPQLPVPPAPKPAVSQVDPSQSTRPAAQNCSPFRMAEVALKGGPIGSC
ncbi:ABC transporter permease family protein [Gordonia aurantiaca]|uniref:hypothetical protein n=1 Tax=Gordonia sp. B21 TaxID=3151852 RepID=UPI003264C1D2